MAMSDGAASYLALTLAYGMFHGGWSAVMPAVPMDQFGGRLVSGIIGTLAIGTLIGPTLAGVAFNLLQSYWLPIAAGAALNLPAAWIARRLPHPRAPS